MILSDISIHDQIQKGRLLISPEPADEQFQPTSIDLTLDREFQSPYADEPVYQDRYLLGPGECVLATTQEYVQIPDDIVARVEGKSSWGRKFLLAHSTAGYVDPGFCGTITLELVNLSAVSQIVATGDRIAQMSFHWVDQPVARPYGAPGLGSHYQHQAGVTASAEPWR